MTHGNTLLNFHLLLFHLYFWSYVLIYCRYMIHIERAPEANAPAYVFNFLIWTSFRMTGVDKMFQCSNISFA